MSDPAPEEVQLLLYGFDAAVRFEGRLVGALGGDAGDALRALGAGSRTLEDAVAQPGGTRISSGFIEGSTLPELLPQLASATAANPVTRSAT